jgi:hypothetical protein
MAQPTNLYDTYDTTGIREDLVDVIYNISLKILQYFPQSQDRLQNKLSMSGK